MRSIGVMMVTARCFGMLLSRGCATRHVNNGMQPRRTRWKEKLPKNQQPCEVLSAMLEHALGAKEVEFQKLRARPVRGIVTVRTACQSRMRNELLNFSRMVTSFPTSLQACLPVSWPISNQSCSVANSFPQKFKHYRRSRILKATNGSLFLGEDFRLGLVAEALSGRSLMREVAFESC